LRPNIRTSWSNLTASSKRYVNNVLDRGWLSYSLYMPRFERLVAQRHGARYGVLVNSGTDALRISWLVLKEIHRWPDNAEVIVPALTFVATVNAVIQARLRPVFADVEFETGNLNQNALDRTISRRTVAACAVHLFGLPATITPRSLVLVEDSCETFGVHRLEGVAMCMSFYMSHHVAAGVGGMILTNSKRFANLARSYQNHGRVDDGSHFKFGRVGYSSRATELEAALGVAALEHVDTDLLIRSKLARRYHAGLMPATEVYHPLYVSAGHSWMFYPVLLKGSRRDEMLRYLKRRGIESREAMPLINQPVFRGYYKPGSCPNAELWTKNGLLLPLHPKMTESDVDVVCRAVKLFFK